MKNIFFSAIVLLLTAMTSCTPRPSQEQLRDKCDSLLNLAKFAYNANLREDAINYCDQAIAIDSTYWKIYYAKGAYSRPPRLEIPFDEWVLNAYLNGIEFEYGLERKDYCGLSIRKLYTNEHKYIKWEFVNDKPFAIFNNYCGIKEIYVRLNYITYILGESYSRVFFALYNDGKLQIPFYMDVYKDKEDNIVDIDREKYD